MKKTTVLLYDFDDEILNAFAKLDAAFDQARASKYIWHLKTKAAVSDIKYSGGALSVVDMENIRLSKFAPPGVKTNVRPMAVRLGQRTLYFFPDRILVLDALGFGAVNYQSLKVELERSTMVIKGGKPPSDARIIEYTWQYVNKSGGPDRRFGNNPQFPVIEVGELKFSSDSGFQSILKFSNVGRAEALVNGIRQFAAVAATDRR